MNRIGAADSRSGQSLCMALGLPLSLAALGNRLQRSEHLPRRGRHHRRDPAGPT